MAVPYPSNPHPHQVPANLLFWQAPPALGSSGWRCFFPSSHPSTAHGYSESMRDLECRCAGSPHSRDDPRLPAQLLGTYAEACFSTSLLHHPLKRSYSHATGGENSVDIGVWGSLRRMLIRCSFPPPQASNAKSPQLVNFS